MQNLETRIHEDRLCETLWTYAYQRGVNVTLEEGDPGATLVARRLARIALKRIRYADLTVDPFGNQMSRKKLSLSVVLLLHVRRRARKGLERNVQVGEAVVKCAVHGDVPTDCNI